MTHTFADIFLNCAMMNSITVTLIITICSSLFHMFGIGVPESTQNYYKTLIFGKIKII